MQWITIVIIGFAANLDNLGIGLAYGLKKIKISHLANLVIAAVSMMVTFFSVLAGIMLTLYISPFLANLFGSMLLCIVGFWMLISIKIKRPTTEVLNSSSKQNVTFKESITLGFILAANCLASGVGVGANGLSILGTVLSIGFFSFVSIGASSYFGILLSRTFIGKYPTQIAGSLLILIGIFELFV